METGVRTHLLLVERVFGGRRIGRERSSQQRSAGKVRWARASPWKEREPRAEKRACHHTTSRLVGGLNVPSLSIHVQGQPIHAGSGR